MNCRRGDKSSAVLHCGEHAMSAESLVWQLEEVLFIGCDGAGRRVHEAKLTVAPVVADL